MPPQPLSRVRPAAGLIFTPELTIRRPEVAMWMAQCIAVWSWVETQMSRMFATLSGINVEAGVELYNSFGGASLKVNAFKVLARARLSPDDYKILDALLKVVDSHEKTRNKIAHWYWGYSEQIDDGLVLIDPKHILIQTARMADIQNAGARLTADDMRYPLDKIYVYRTSDLKHDADSFISLALLVNKCHGLCTRKGPELVSLRGELSKDGRLAQQLMPFTGHSGSSHHTPPDTDHRR
jgi:hypothetical protein